MDETARTKAAIRAVTEFRQELAEMKPSEMDCVAIERRAQEVANAVGRALMGEALARADMVDPEITIDGEPWGNRRTTRGTYVTIFGEVDLDRSTYQQAGRGRVAVPLELRLGIVEGRYTPRCARVMTRATALVPAEEAAGLLEEVGVAQVGVATLHRVPRAIARRYEIEQARIDQAVREQDAVPAEAVTVQVGIDGVMVPQDGEHARPRGRRTREPEPPRHEKRYGPSPMVATAATDDESGRSWHEGSVGTLTFFDKQGERLKTLYLAQMPEAGKKTLARRLEEELRAVVSERPDTNICFASDGAPQHWSLLKAMHKRLPEEACGTVDYIVDFWHVAEYLESAANAVCGEGTPEARVAGSGWKETMRELPDGTQRILKAFRYHRDQAHGKNRVKIQKAIRFIAKQSRLGRTRFAQARARGLPIGTGVTEAAAKTVVNVRMKRAGARYSQHGGQTIMHFRTAILSRRFEPLSRQIEATYTATPMAA